MSQVNDCGNGGEAREEPNGLTDPIEGGAENVGCQNTASEIQGDGNTVALESEQEFEEEELMVPAPTP